MLYSLIVNNDGEIQAAVYFLIRMKMDLDEKVGKVRLDINEL